MVLSASANARLQHPLRSSLNLCLQDWAMLLLERYRLDLFWASDPGCFLAEEMLPYHLPAANVFVRNQAETSLCLTLPGNPDLSKP